MAFFEQAEVTIGPIYDISQILEDPHVLERELIADYPDPDMGAFPMHHVVPRLSGTPGAIRTPAPRLGEHNRAAARRDRRGRRRPTRGCIAAGAVSARATLTGHQQEEERDETRSAGLALAALRAGQRREVRRQGAHPRRRRAPARPRGRGAPVGEGEGAHAGREERGARAARRRRRGGAHQPAARRWRCATSSTRSAPTSTASPSPRPTAPRT